MFKKKEKQEIDEKIWDNPLLVYENYNVKNEYIINDIINCFKILLFYGMFFVISAMQYNIGKIMYNLFWLISIPVIICVIFAIILRYYCVILAKRYPRHDFNISDKYINFLIKNIGIVSDIIISKEELIDNINYVKDSKDKLLNFDNIDLLIEKINENIDNESQEIHIIDLDKNIFISDDLWERSKILVIMDKSNQFKYNERKIKFGCNWYCKANVSGMDYLNILFEIRRGNTSILVLLYNNNKIEKNGVD